MVVYADILIVLNLIVNYFLLLFTAKLLRIKTKTMRLLLGAFTGAVASLYIFLPQMPAVSEFSFKAVLCLVITFISYKANTCKQFIKSAAVFFAVTCAYAGIMLAVWRIFKPNGMAINNSVVYFNISPLILVLSTVAAYLAVCFFYKIFRRTAACAGECDIQVRAGDSTVEFRAIVDTGNSVSDLFGKSEIIITDKSVIDSLFADCDSTDTRYRAIPYNTVSGSGILDGYRCDDGKIISGEKTVLLDKPILAASKTPINSGYSAIVNPEFLD